MRALRLCAPALVATFLLCGSAFAGEGEWIVRKTSGEVWTGQAAQPVSLTKDAVLKAGDTVTTGRNGRVLLVRGEESILIAPNSVIGIPTEKKDGLATTITQRAGSILLEVERKKNPHFEVETPYLAAVVKGTQFRVSVTETGARVDVTRGQVEVADFHSGEIAQVRPGQAAETHAGLHGLHLSGRGDFLPIEHGTPRNSTLTPITVPKGGLKTPPGLDRNRTRDAMHSGHGTSAAVTHRAGVIRISAPLGDVRLNFHKVTHGLARNAGTVADLGRRDLKETTVWGSGGSSSSSLATSAASSTSSSNGSSSSSNSGGNSGSNGGNGGPSASTPVATAIPPGSNGCGNGNGNCNGHANNGNGNNGNGNGNGNGGNGNGNGKGNGKH